MYENHDHDLYLSETDDISGKQKEGWVRLISSR